MPANDSGTALLMGVRANFPADIFVLEELNSRRWSSMTFAGARHELAFRLEGEGADREASRFLGGLSATRFPPLPGHLLARISLVSEERRPGNARIKIEALTVEDQ